MPGLIIFPMRGMQLFHDLSTGHGNKYDGKPSIPKVICRTG